jgi:hypothetical protein
VHRPLYTEQVRAVVGRLIELELEADKLAQARRAIESEGYATGSLLGVPSRHLWARFGRFDDYNSPIRCFLRGCETEGYLKEADYLPPEVKG